MDFQQQRMTMLEHQIKARGIENQEVLAAMALVPREKFVSEDMLQLSYGDGALPIDCAQTISQPFVVAYMLEKLAIQHHERVLEIGTGSGYNAAVISEVAREVYTMDIIHALLAEAAQKLNSMGYQNIHLKHGDGLKGWPEQAPFDVIILTAAPLEVEQELFAQLAEGGRLIAPVGDKMQNLILYKKINGNIRANKLIPVRFVPMVDEQYLLDKGIIRKT